MDTSKIWSFGGQYICLDHLKKNQDCLIFYLNVQFYLSMISFFSPFSLLLINCCLNSKCIFLSLTVKSGLMRTLFHISSCHSFFTIRKSLFLWFWFSNFTIILQFEVFDPPYFLDQGILFVDIIWISSAPSTLWIISLTVCVTLSVYCDNVTDWLKKVEAEVKHLYTLPLYTLLATHN